MKKRLISMLLTVLMVASLFSGMSLNAYADDVFEYTMTEGDTVLAVCNANGLNYYTCKNAIMALNGFTSEQNFRFIPVGKVIKLPVSNAVAVTIAANGTTTTTNQTGSTTTTVSTTTNASGDTIAYWLIPYTLQRGETVYSVCNALGISYNTYAEQIQKLNNVKSLSWVKAGQTLLFPSVKTPAVGVSCYEVRAHKVTAGETAYSMCNANGVSYNGNVQLLQALNNKDNLNYVASGSTFYMPVSTVISASTGASGSTVGGSTAATPTAAPVSSAAATAAPVQKVTYALKGNGSTGGTVAFYVDGKVVTEASAGDVVTVVPTPDSGKAVKSLSVVFADGSAVPPLSGGDTFVMPTCAVTANVEFKGGYTITLDSNFTSYVKVLVDGVAGSSASAGSLVQIVSGDPSFSVTDAGIVVTKSNGGDVKSSTDNSFKMPSDNVTVKVELEAVKTYDFYKKCIAAQGNFVLQSNGNTISKAAKGTEVTVLASPSVGYAVDMITITLRDEDGSLGTSFTAKNNKFTMPAQDVQVEVTFAPETSVIEIAGTINGKVVVNDASGKKATVGTTGETYTIVLTPDAGYTAQKPTVKSLYDQTMVTVTKVSDTEYTFVMPGKGALVSVGFAGDTPFPVVADARLVNTATTAAGCTVRVNNSVATNDAATTVTIGEGGLVSLSTSLPDGYVLSRYEVKFNGSAIDQELTNGANTNSAFLMPRGAVEVIVYVEAQPVAVKSLSLENCTVKFVDNDDPGKEVTAYKVGDTARIIVTPKDGYTVKASQVLVTGAVSGSAIATTEIATNTQFTFTMPAEGVNVSVDSTKVNYLVKLGTVNSSNAVVTARIGLAGVQTVVLTTDGIKSAVGEPVFIDLSADLKAQGYTISKIITTTESRGRIDYAWFNTFSFPMPAEEVIVDVVVNAPATAITADLANCTMDTYLASDTINKVAAFTPGQNVLVKLTAKNGYFLSDISGNKLVSISGVDSSALSKLVVADDGLTAEIRFIMPEGQVLVTAKAEQRVRTFKIATLGADFTNVTADGKTAVLGTAARDIHAGQTVSVALTAEQAKLNKLDSIKLFDTTSSHAELTSVKITYSNGVASFVMPDQDVQMDVYASAK